MLQYAVFLLVAIIANIYALNMVSGGKVRKHIIFVNTYFVDN